MATNLSFIVKNNMKILTTQSLKKEQLVECCNCKRKLPRNKMTKNMSFMGRVRYKCIDEEECKKNK